MSTTYRTSASISPATAPSRLDRYRRRQRALTVAAELAASHPDDLEAVLVLAHRGWCGAFGDLHHLAAAAQEEWWHRVLARVDASFVDDLAGVAPEARYQAVRNAWAAQWQSTPGYLLLAALGAGDPGYDPRQRRYARILALFAGTASVGEEDDLAARAGLNLVKELSGAGLPV